MICAETFGNGATIFTRSITTRNRRARIPRAPTPAKPKSFAAGRGVSARMPADPGTGNESPGYADVCFGYDIYGFRCVRAGGGLTAQRIGDSYQREGERPASRRILPDPNGRGKRQVGS